MRGDRRAARARCSAASRSPGTTTERPTGMIPSGSSPCRPVRGWRSRVRRPAGRCPSGSSRRGRAGGAPRPDARSARRRRPSTTTRTARRCRSSCVRPPANACCEPLGAELDRRRRRRRARGAPSRRRSGRSPRRARPRRGAPRAAARRSALPAAGARRRTCPRRPIGSGSAAASAVAAALDRSPTRSATESCGPSSAAIAARCSGSKMPTRLWSLSRLIRSTISALPTTKPIRQPAMPYVFDIDHISTPTSFAPGVARKLCGRAPVVDEVDVGGVVHDRAAGALGPADGGLERARRRADRARVRRVVEVERGGGRRCVEVGRPAALGTQRRPSRARAPASAAPDG